MDTFDLIKSIKEHGEINAVILWFRHELRSGDPNVPYCALRGALSDEFELPYNSNEIHAISQAQRVFEEKI